MKIALYLRVSTDVQDYNRQKSDLTAYAEKQGNEVAYIFSDKVSGFKDEKNRPELNQLLQLTKEDIQAVYISELSRLSRNPTYLKVLIDEFSAKGINVYSQAQNLNTINADGATDLITSFAISLFSELGKYEIDLKNIRQKSGKRESVTVKGNAYTSKPPYGYKKEAKKLVINPKEADVVSYIFNQYATGTSIKELIQYLNLNKIPTRNSDFMKKEVFKVNKSKSIDKADIKWGKSSVRNILRNTVYCGYVVIKSGERLSTPPIITEALFQNCQEQIKERITNTDKSRVNNFMLRGILFCGFCGKPFVGTSSHKHLLYKCSDKTQLKSNSYLGCKNTSIFKEHIESIIWKTVKGTYSELRSKQIKASNIDSLNNSIIDCKQQIEAIESELNRLFNESDRLLKQYAKGLFSDSQIEKVQRQINTEVESFTRSKRKLQAQITKDNETLQAIAGIDNKPFDLSEIEKSFELQKEAVHELIKEVLIHKVDNKYTIFEVTFKTGYKYFIIRETWTKKYATLSSNTYTFNKEGMLFTFKGNVGTGLNYEGVTVTQTPKELFKMLEISNQIENDESYLFAIEEENKAQEEAIREI